MALMFDRGNTFGTKATALGCTGMVSVPDLDLVIKGGAWDILLV
jgi:hypothetical protein